MGYCITADLKKLLPEAELLQLADDSGSASGLDHADVAIVLAEAIDQADREIDGYVGLAATMPLSPVPGLVQNLSARMAVYRLYARRSAVPDLWQRDYERAVRILERIAEGKLSLGVAAEETSEPGSGILVSGPDKIFTDWEKY